MQPKFKLFDPDWIPLQIGDRVLLLGSTGPYQDNSKDPSPFFEISMVERIPALGGKGTLLLWTQAGAAIAGYLNSLDGKAAAGTIPAGAGVACTPNGLSLQSRQLGQFRFVVHIIGVPHAGWALDDLDITLFAPASSQRWFQGGAGLAGVRNAMYQFPMPSDVITLPAQNANLAQPGLYAGVDAIKAAVDTEFFVAENNPPRFNFANNGGFAMDGAGSAIGLGIGGYIYNFEGMVPDGSWTRKRIAGMDQVLSPPDWRDCALIPVAGRNPTGR